MKIVLIIGLLVIFTSCYTAIGDQLIDVPHIVKAYNNQKGGIQIVSLNPVEHLNSKVLGVNDEWITLVAHTPDSLHFTWFIRTCLANVTVDTTIHIVDTMRIYTHQAPATDHSALSLGFGANYWIMADTGNCYATLVGSNGGVIDSLSYRIDP